MHCFFFLLRLTGFNYRWNGGLDGLDLHGPSCIWPFCHSHGGEEGSSGGDNGNEEDEPSKRWTSLQKPTSNASRTSETDSCSASTTTASKCSVTCVPRTGRSTESCTTTCYASSTGCSIAGSITTTTQTPAPLEEICAPSCRLCNGDRMSMPRISIGNHKRVLPIPPKYPAAITAFMNDEISKSFTIPHDLDDSTGARMMLEKTKLNGAVIGLWGCTTVIVVSRKAIYMSHLWESDFQKSDSIFQTNVLNALEYGIPLHGHKYGMPSLRLMADDQGPLAAQWNPEIIIVTRAARWKSPADVAGAIYTMQQQDVYYPEQIGKIVELMQRIIPNQRPIKPRIIGYFVNKRDSDVSTRLYGKVLLQYDPAEVTIQRSKDSCFSYQQAMIRLWVGNAMSPWFQKCWTALPEQRISSDERKALAASACAFSDLSQLPSPASGFPQDSVAIKT